MSIHFCEFATIIKSENVTDFILSYLGVYSLVLITILSCYALANLLYLHGLFRACIIIHDRLVDSILGSTFR
jgi:hypothetical protein